MSKGTLYIVATPIGNLDDITMRAVRTLKEVDLIAAEDTRHTAGLLNHYGISKPMISYWGEREKVRAEETITRLAEGQNIALVSDAGTPGISDPGCVLIKRAIEEGINIVPVPGPSAVIAALSISGLPTEQFLYAGFLPAKQSQRKKALQELCPEKRTIVFYEAPHRILETLADMAEVFGDRQAAVVKEITKLFEETTRSRLKEICGILTDAKIAGEYVIIVAGRGEERSFTMRDALSEARALMKKGLSRKDAVRRIADEYGLSKKELYDLSLKEK